MKIKKILALLLSAAMLLSVMTACAPDEEGDGTTLGTQGGFAGVTTSPKIDTSKYEVTEPVTIEFWHASAEGKDEYQWYVQACEKFNASQDKITVVPVYAGGYDEIMTKLGAAIQAREGIPGLCQVNMNNIVSCMATGLMEPLQDYIAAWDMDTSDIVEGFLDVGVYDGNLYAFPQSVSVAVFLYNKTILSQYGLDEVPSNYDDFNAWCKDVYEKTGKPAYAVLATEQNGLYNFGVNWGGVFVNDDGTTGFCNESVQKYVADMKEMADAGYILWSNEKTSSIHAMFKNGDLMGESISCTSYTTLQKNPNGYEIGVAWNYNAEQGISTVAGAYNFIPSELDQNTKNAAFLFLEYLSSAENNLEWAEISSYMVTHKSTINDATKMAKIYESLPGMEVVYEHINDIKQKPSVVSYKDVMKVWYNGIAQIIIEGEDPDTMWAQIEKDMNTRLAED